MREIIIRDVVRLFVFMAPLQILQLLFVWKMKRRDSFVVRFLFAELLYVFLGATVIIGIYKGIWNEYFVLWYFMVFLCSYFFIYICYDIPHIEIIFATASGYALQHIGNASFSIVSYYLKLEYSDFTTWEVMELIFQVLIGVMAYFLLIRKYEYTGEHKEKDGKMVAIAVVIVITTLFLSNWSDNVLQNLGPSVRIFSGVICKVYGILCCLLAVSMEYTVSYLNVINRQKEFMDQMIQTQANQLKISQDSISIINRKCHDIKYQMKALRAMDNSKTRQEYIDELQKAISIYDSVYHTGNEALNLLLREKTLLCDEYHIQFSCMADGKTLEFIATDDLYVLLGNALDNAIECVLKEEDEEKRIISLKIGTQHGMKNIHLENSCKEKIKFKDGLPVTSKKDKNHHGFGVRSIQYVSEKYHGNMVIQNTNDMYCLDLFFPYTD